MISWVMGSKSEVKAYIAAVDKHINVQSTGKTWSVAEQSAEDDNLFAARKHNEVPSGLLNEVNQLPDGFYKDIDRG